MKDRKPIFVVELPIHADYDNIIGTQQTLEKQIGKEYHVLIYSGVTDDIKFQLFNNQDVEDINLEELKELIKNQMINR